MRTLLATLSQAPPADIQRAHAAYSGVAKHTGQVSAFDPDQLCFGPLRELLLSRIAGGLGQPRMADAFDNLKTSGLKAHSLKSFAAAGARAGGIGAALATVYSGIHCGSDVLKGKISPAQAVGQVGAEAMGGFWVGSAAGIGSGLTMWGLRSLGVAGIPLSLGTATVGAVSGWGASQAYQQSGLRSALTQGLTRRAGHMGVSTQRVLRT